jgi:hypothetical protein
MLLRPPNQSWNPEECTENWVCNNYVLIPSRLYAGPLSRHIYYWHLKSHHYPQGGSGLLALAINCSKLKGATAIKVNESRKNKSHMTLLCGKTCTLSSSSLHSRGGECENKKEFQQVPYSPLKKITAYIKHLPFRHARLSAHQNN